MLKKAHVDRVLIQAEYQSGDRYGIASSLKLDPKLGIVILHRENDPKTANELKQLYSTVDNAKHRVELIPVPAKKDTAKYKKLAAQKAGGDLGLLAVQFEYANATHEDVISGQRSKRSALIKAAVEDPIDLLRVSGGTYIIADQFKNDPISARNALRKFWKSDKEDKIAEWLSSKGFRPDRRYVFLAVKGGNPTAEKAHHFTSILTWRLLIDSIIRETSFVPVAVGENIGINTSPSLIEFWNEKEWKVIFDNHPTRQHQLGLWCYLAAHFGSCSMVGMRSGMIEVPSLLGIRTLYIEERGNHQAERMKAWLNKDVENWHWNRLEVERPPGISQQIYMANYKHTRAPTDAEKRNTDLFTLGFARATLKKKIEGVFDRHTAMSQLGLDVQQFMIRPTELSEIIEWIKKAPEANQTQRSLTPPRHDLHASGKGTVAVEEHARNKTAARSWSEYFASDEYRQTLPLTPRSRNL